MRAPHSQCPPRERVQIVEQSSARKPEINSHTCVAQVPLRFVGTSPTKLVSTPKERLNTVCYLVDFSEPAPCDDLFMRDGVVIARGPVMTRARKCGFHSSTMEIMKWRLMGDRPGGAAVQTVDK